MLQNFRTYQLAKELYKECQSLKLHGEIKDQLNRSVLSICLNLAEGTGKPTAADRKRFYAIALGSTRETQAILDLLDHPNTKKADQLGAMIFRLTQNPG